MGWWSDSELKRWKRQWKIDLIERDIPEWFDLYRSLNRGNIQPLPETRAHGMGGRIKCAHDAEGVVGALHGSPRSA
jgi:hypothetical protein